MKYQPYHGIRRNYWLHSADSGASLTKRFYFTCIGFPKRRRTKGDWQWNCDADQDHSWRRLTHNSRRRTYLKSSVHRMFRKAACRAINEELHGNDGVSHYLVIHGDCLD